MNRESGFLRLGVTAAVLINALSYTAAFAEEEHGQFLCTVCYNEREGTFHDCCDLEENCDEHTVCCSTVDDCETKVE